MYKIIFLIVGMFALGLDAYVIAGLLPQVSQAFNTTDAETGQAVTLFTLCYALAAPIFATLLAGKPVRIILVIALVIFSLANAASALSSTLTFLLISRAVSGIGAGLFSPIAIAATASLFTVEKRGRALGFTLGGMSCGTVIGVPIGLQISNYFGWQGTLWLVTLLGIICLLGIVLYFPSISVNQPPSLKQRVVMLYERKVSLTVMVTFLTAIASLGMYTYTAPFVSSQMSPLSITPYLWVWGLGGVIGSLTVGYIIDWIKKPNLILACILAILAVSLLLMPLSTHFGSVVFIPIILWGMMGWSSLAPQQHNLIQYQPKHSAAALGLNSSCNYLGSAVGALLGGLILSLDNNISLLPYFAGTIAVLAFILQLYICNSSNNK